MIQTDEFLSESINSKYYTPDEFIGAKLNKDSFTIFHLNIASLQSHIDELRALLLLLDYPFEIIGITETKILEDHDPLVPIDIENYIFRSIPTKSNYGGSGIYFRNNIEFEIRKDLTKSEENVGECIFAQIAHSSGKKIVVGVIYRHHTSIKNFVDTFLLDILVKNSKKNKKFGFYSEMSMWIFLKLIFTMTPIIFTMY